MKTNFKKLILFLLLILLFNNFAFTHETYQVIRVLDGDTFVVDFNSNGVVDEDEKIRINGIDAFETRRGKALERQMEFLGISKEEVLKLGQLGAEFATKELLNKSVTVIYSGKTKRDSTGRLLVSLKYDNGKDYEQEILKAGLAIVYFGSNIAPDLIKYQDKAKILARLGKTITQIDPAQALNNDAYVVLNQQSGVYHRQGCRYASTPFCELIHISDAKKYTPCKACFKEVKNIENVEFDIENQEDGQDNIYKSTPVNPIVEQGGTIQTYYVAPVGRKKPMNDCSDEACSALLNLINGAKETIDFAIYGIYNQDAIYNALIQAKKRGVKIRGLVDMDDKKYNPYKDTVRLVSELGTVKTDYKEITDFVPRKYDYIQQVDYLINGQVVEASFVNKGIKDYNNLIMHNKYFIFDKQTVWTGSMNISSTCATYNSNSSVAIQSPALAKLYTEDFEQMYLKNNFHKDKAGNQSPKIIKLNENTTITAFLLPQDKQTYYAIKEKIDGAQKYIYVPMFFFTHARYPQDLINAYNRGVDVKVIVDATSARTGYTKHEILRMAGIPVKVENWGGKMHEKSMIIDDKYLLIGSMNFTSTAHSGNDENSLLIEDADLAIKARKRFEYLWASIPNKWLKANPAPEGRDSPNSCSDGINNDHSGLIDKDNPNCRLIRFPQKEDVLKKYHQSGPMKN